MRIIIFPYNNASGGARELRDALIARGQRVIIPRGTRSAYRWKPGDIIVNWGNSQPLAHEGLKNRDESVPIINPPNAVDIVSNKLNFFRHMDKKLVRIPRWTDNRDVVRTWLLEGHSVCIRSVLRGSSGEGLSVFSVLDDEIPKAPLYTRYVKKRDEYRVHVLGDKIIDVQRKAIRPGVEKPNFQIRNLDNGFIFVRQDLKTPDDVIQQSLMTIEKCGLHFGAVDVIWNDHEQQAYVLEVNTAPGLQGQTVISYAEALIERLKT